MLANWLLVFKILMHSGRKMIISERNRVVWAHVVVTVRVHRRRIHQVAVHMGLEMEMDMHRIWAHYPHPHRVCSIQHQVSTLHFRIGRSIEKIAAAFFAFSAVLFHNKKNKFIVHAWKLFAIQNHRSYNLYRTLKFFVQKQNVKNVDNLENIEKKATTTIK